MEKLRQCWDAYTQILEKQLKHSSAGTFKSARLVIENDIRFTITVSAITSQKFVEQERMMLIDHLHKEFNNRAISFEVLVEAGEQQDIPAHMRLNSKQKFEHIAEQYPLVKELRDRLKLEIDY
jgi:DNA polymerase-3 subunit gamma/tau